MATNLQRLIIMVVLMDFMIGLVAIFAFSSSLDYANTQAEEKIGMYENWTTQYNERVNTETDDEDRTILNPSFGDAKASGKGIWELMKKGVSIQDFGTCLGENCSYLYVYWIVFGVTTFIALIHLLLGLEIYFVIFNRKYT